MNIQCVISGSKKEIPSTDTGLYSLLISFLIFFITGENTCTFFRRWVKTKGVKFQSSFLKERGFVQVLRKKLDHDSRRWVVKDKEPQHMELFFLSMRLDSKGSWPSLFLTSYIFSLLPNEIWLHQHKEASDVIVWARETGGKRTTRLPLRLIYRKLFSLWIFPFVSSGCGFHAASLLKFIFAL